MSGLKVCRICLARGIKMYSYNCYYLKQYYEEVMAKKVYDEDGLPHHFCYLCSAMLYKLHKFKEKCYTGEKVLMELLWSGSLTLSSISQTERQDKNLQSTLGMIRISKRVRTCIMESKTLSRSPSTEEINKIEIPENVKSLNYDSDNSLDDKILANIKNEMLNEKPDSIPDENLNMLIEKPVEKAFSDSDDDRISSEDNDLNPVLINEEVKPSNIEEINIKTGIDDENLNIKIEKANNENENTTTKIHKEQKFKKNKQSKGTKLNKFEGLKSKKSNLDPKHWLKINLTEEEALEDFQARARDRKYLKAAFQCTLCYKGFSKEDMLNRHNKLRHSESLGPMECRFCKMRFKWKCHLTRHVVQHYTKYKCLRCDLCCPLESTAYIHNDYHNGVLRKCIHCGEEFRHSSTYYTHLRTHRSKHVCTLCGASFVSVTGLSIHKKIKHVNPDSELPQGEEQYCQRCDVKFETRKAYEEHLIHSAMHVDGIEDLEINAPITSNPRKCRLTRNRPTDCHVCGKHFATQAACRKHHLAEHPHTSLFAPNERHICEICGMSLVPGSVSSHLNTHTREKLYTCNTCGRQFNSKGGMTKHQLTHTSEKPVACTLCDKRFKQVSSMKLHYRTFHLKEPYPKRNRKKKTDKLSKDEYGHEDSDDDMTLDNFYARKYK